MVSRLETADKDSDSGEDDGTKEWMTEAVGVRSGSLGLDLVGKRLPRPVSLFVHC